jgi:hypothetical protein
LTGESSIKPILCALTPISDRINPHKIKAKTPADVAERNQRIAQGIRQFDASSAPVGFTEAPYATPPTTRYQRAMRHTNEFKVRNHVTDQASLAVIEASTTIPLEAGKNHKCKYQRYFLPCTAKSLSSVAERVFRTFKINIRQ